MCCLFIFCYPPIVVKKNCALQIVDNSDYECNQGSNNPLNNINNVVNNQMAELQVNDQSLKLYIETFKL